MEYLNRLKTLDAAEQTCFLAEFAEHKKNVTVGVLLALLLGAFGAHRHYMGQSGLGLLYLLFFWTLISGLVALVEVVLMSERVYKHNDLLTIRIIDRIEGQRT